MEAVDETFLERMLWGCMDLVSGSLLFEEVAEDRRDDTWYALGAARLEALGAGGLSLVSDRAQALVKLAETGLECLSIPDVFPLIHALVKRSALSICGRRRQARQALSPAQEHLRTCQASHPSGADVQQAQAAVEASEAEGTRWESVHRASRHPLETVALLVHPWRLVDSTRQTSEAVERQLHAETRAIAGCIARHGVPGKQKALANVRKQRVGVSALVALGWQGVWRDRQPVTLTPRGTRGIEDG